MLSKQIWFILVINIDLETSDMFKERDIIGRINWPRLFANFLTFVVDMICLLRIQSATKPLTAVMNHMNKKGIPANTPFYNKTANAQKLYEVAYRHIVYTSLIYVLVR